MSKNSQFDAESRPASQAGFTLVELMISLTVVSIAIAAAFAMAFSLMNGFRDNRAAVQVESTARTVLDIIATGVRAASPGLTGGLVWDPCGDSLNGEFITTIHVTNSSTGSDRLRVIHASGGALAFITSKQNVLSGTALTVDDNDAFEKDFWTPAIIIDPLTAKGHLIEVNASSVDSESIATRMPGNCTGAVGEDEFLAGSIIVRAVHMDYIVDPPFLMVDPDGPGAKPDVVMAEGIEDMQIAVGVEDGSDDTSLTELGALPDDDEWHHNVALDSGHPTVDGGQWRALRITVIGYTQRDQKNTVTGNVTPGVEDRPAGSTADGLRRRAFSTTVDLRNFSAGN